MTLRAKKLTDLGLGIGRQHCFNWFKFFTVMDTCWVSLGHLNMSQALSHPEIWGWGGVTMNKIFSVN